MGEAAGNATQAARLAGYKGSEITLATTGHEVLRNPKVAAAIAERVAQDPAIATREARQAWWSKVMDDPKGDMKDRLRASELLGKSQADFIARQQVEHSGSLAMPETKDELVAELRETLAALTKGEA